MGLLEERSKQLLDRTKKFEEQVTTDAKIEEIRAKIGETSKT